MRLVLSGWGSTLRLIHPLHPPPWHSSPWLPWGWHRHTLRSLPLRLRRRPLEPGMGLQRGISRRQLQHIHASWWDGLSGRSEPEPPPEWTRWEEGEEDEDDDAYRGEAVSRPERPWREQGDSFRTQRPEPSQPGTSRGGNQGGRADRPGEGLAQGAGEGRWREQEESGIPGRRDFTDDLLQGNSPGSSNSTASSSSSSSSRPRQRRRKEDELSSLDRSSLVGGPFDDVDDVIDNPEKFRAWRRIREVRDATEEYLETGRGAPDDDPPWEDWLDDPDEYKDVSSWYELNPDPWEKEGMPRPPPRIPERGLSRTFTELLPLIFLPQDAVEEELTFEEKVFRYTSQATARFLLVLLLVPWVGSWFAHDSVFVPLTHRWVEKVPLVASTLDLRESQKLQLIQQLKLERQRVRFESEIGKAPPISEEQLAAYLQEEAHHLREEIRHENQESFAFIFSDAIGLGLFVALLYLNPTSVAIMRLTGTRIFTNISDTGKAFTIILASDIFLGYHSQSGWETLIEMFLDHYGLEADPNGIFIFIATVPVTMDCFFKLWVFRSLTRMSPSLAATLKEMQRH